MVYGVNTTSVLIHRMASLADANRLRLLRLLERQELGVAELCDVVQLPQSTVSRHLKVLADEGWVCSRRDGTTNLYRMLIEELEESARRLWGLAREQTEGWAATKHDGIRLMRRLRARQKTGAAFFAGAAGQWDRIRGELYGNRWGREALLALLGRDWVVADLGCGTGLITADLARFVGRVVGVDNSEAMLAAARKTTADLSNVQLRKGDLESIPIEDASCDAALLVLVLAYVPDPPVVFDQLHRILKPGGRAAIVDHMKHDRDDLRRQMGQQWLGFEPDQLCRMIEQAGLNCPSCAALEPEPDAKGPALLLATAEKPVGVSK